MISQLERPSRPATIARHSIKASGNSPRPTALCRIAEKEGGVARGIARRAARRARMIMAMQAAYQRAAAPDARRAEMPQGGMIRDNANAPM